MSIVYHVTFTRNVASIRRRGLLIFQPTLWVKAGNGERYGDGSVYAFSNRLDAIRWAGRMDWEFHKKTGSGKVSIVAFRDDGLWQVDDADPLSQAGSQGIWLKRLRSVPASDVVNSEIVGLDELRSTLETKKAAAP